MLRHSVVSFPARAARQALVLGILALSAPAAWAAIETAVLEKAEAMLREGKAQEVYDLLEPREVEGAGDLVYDYLLGTAALESGKPSKATFIYERILAVEPGYIGVRADMGRAYYALGDLARAKIEFETVLNFQNLPPDLRGQVEQYAKAITERAAGQRTVFTGYLELGIGHDSNIGSATGRPSLEFPAIPGFPYLPAPPTGRETRDGYSTVGLGGELNHLLDERWSLFAGGDLRWRGYETYHDPSNWTADGRAGIGYSGGAWQLRGGVTGGTYYYKGDSADKAARLIDNAGVNLDWRLALDQSSQLTAGASMVRRTYVDDASSSEDTDTYTGTLGWMTSLAGGQAIMMLTLSGGVENSVEDRADGDKRFYGPRVFLQSSFTPTLGGYVTVGATYSEYEGLNNLYLKPREEKLYDAGVGLTWAFAKGFSLRPQVTYIKNKSNADLYVYKKTDASLNLRMDF